MRPPHHHAIVAAAGLATVLALGACGNNSSSDGTMPGMDHSSTPMASSNPVTSTPGPGSTDASRAADIMFAQMMIPHHQQAVEMADLALNNPSASGEVKALARQIRQAQDPEIQTMTAWLSSWEAPTAAAMDHGSDGMMSEQDMSALKSAQGEAFNKMWLTMMIQHHEGAVTMSKDALAQTQTATVRTLAQSIIDGQEKEIATMKGLAS